MSEDRNLDLSVHAPVVIIDGQFVIEISLVAQACNKGFKYQTDLLYIYKNNCDF